MANKKKNKAELLDALEKSLGIVTQACKKAGFNRSTFYDYYNNDEEFAQKADDIREMKRDFVESKLMEQIKNNDSQAIRFAAETLLKDRGYSKRTEITGRDGGPVEVDFTDAQ